ncbi:MAG: phosphoribosylformylglycinamidine synthase subunit PurS [Canidatus Methanoxibalbensis ujae]|nr:phosphoribosylformylglycinamidine synthase subunit PurS [Candidatus Methanoxibalbensis ujae]MCW7077679.1 phosphoribosylformylglycinamidine synthase subunit PurS [Candidatus Methanoxibalbensis ujae]
MPVIEVIVKLKQGVADPEGENTRKALNLLGFDDVRRVRTMKVFSIEIESNKDSRILLKEAEEMCEKLLANPVIHDYEIRVRER